jgi:CysZ protein
MVTFVGEFGQGMRMLLRGFSWWRRRPGLMATGLIPALLVALVLAAGYVVLAVNLPTLTEALTPFAEGWPGFWVATLQILVGTALVGGALVLTAVTFTALTLLVGDPFYERIWREIERELGGEPTAARYGFWRSVADSLSLIARGIAAALAAALAGLVPGIGGVLSFGIGATLGGWLLADELTSRALAARGIPAPVRARLRGRRRGLSLGYGVAVRLCFLVPLGAVLTMPAAVAGATELGRALLPDDVSRGRPAAPGSAAPRTA